MKKPTLYTARAKSLNPNCRAWLIKIRRAKKRPVKRAAVPNRTFGALSKRGLSMVVGDWLMCTYPGEMVADELEASR